MPRDGGGRHHHLRRQRADLFRCARAGMERPLPPGRPRRPAVPVLELELALGERCLDPGRRPRLSPSSPCAARAASSCCGRFVQQRLAGLSLLRWMGEPVSQYGDALAARAGPIRPACMLQRAWQFIATRLGADAVRPAQGARRRGRPAPALTGASASSATWRSEQAPLPRPRQRAPTSPHYERALQPQGAQEPPAPDAPT